jgi:hypothetical protein
MIDTCAAAVRHVSGCCFLCLQYTSRAAQLYRQQLEKESVKTFRCAAAKAAAELGPVACDSQLHAGTFRSTVATKTCALCSLVSYVLAAQQCWQQ